MRIGWVRAICSPAITLPSTGRAAKPTMIPAAPAEASSVVPNWRTLGNVLSAAAEPKISAKTLRVRPRTLACVRICRACRLSAMSEGLSRTTTSVSASTAATASQVTLTMSSSVATWRSPTRLVSSGDAASKTACSARSTRIQRAGARAWRTSTEKAGLERTKRTSAAAPAACTASATRIATTIASAKSIQGLLVKVNSGFISRGPLASLWVSVRPSTRDRAAPEWFRRNSRAAPARWRARRGGAIQTAREM